MGWDGVEAWPHVELGEPVLGIVWLMKDSLGESLPPGRELRSLEHSSAYASKGLGDIIEFSLCLSCVIQTRIDMNQLILLTLKFHHLEVQAMYTI